MNLQKLTFKNKDGDTLVGRLELPADQNPHNFALFAHCFTCGKNLSAIKHISRALTANGFGVLRFDFTGLGESEGEFAETNFSGNIKDLVVAAEFLKEHYQSPTLLIGHSLGGTAALYSAASIPSIKAVATIAAPSNPSHVKRLLKGSLEDIEQRGAAIVKLGDREFTIKKQFLDDLDKTPLSAVLQSLNKSILIMHSPQDNLVAIKNAEEIYKAGRHPKSFISLNGADHLLTDQNDSRYVGQVIAQWANRYLDIENEKLPDTPHQVVASLGASDGFTTRMKVGNHYQTADEPIKVGGNDFGPSPYELVSAGLSACTAMTLQMYAKRKKWPLENVEVHTSHSKIHSEDCEDCESPNAKLDTFERELKLTGDLDESQQKRLMEIADKCPVHRTLHATVWVNTKLIE
ncbi:bifunctional alpha/beta hydrolase/OsmC family protein [Flavobacteriaceae bacterium F89]|uniref:Bifunctional alpha/beta hydrolase/OsmC family protein n=1 Tax=Cerina litoralis TaxID=2874477 RepID=A0AAE3EVT3_9FLAO|nr:bifunctional alpha/beta hydrolase/OsmC family protein [Cerina litoralis]MCG2461124.1 bifunctional alpha/beta hydrolase/OsmC family protein [Cerina litoralis]